MKKLSVLVLLLFSFLVLPGFTLEVNVFTHESKIQENVSRVGFNLLNSNRINKIIPFYYESNRKEVNAYASSKNKTVTITKGLMRFIETDDELAAILGHEIGHMIDYYKNPFYTIPMSLDPKAYEFAADKRAIDLMVNAGYNPVAFIVISTKFMGQRDFDWFPWWFGNGWVSTHPKTSRRLAAMYEYIYMKYPQYLANNEYKDNIYYQNFLLTSQENRKRFEAKAKNPSAKVRYK